MAKTSVGFRINSDLLARVKDRAVSDSVALITVLEAALEAYLSSASTVPLHCKDSDDFVSTEVFNLSLQDINVRLGKLESLVEQLSQADNKPPVPGGTKPIKTQNHPIDTAKGSQVANTDAEWLTHTQAFEYAKGKGFGKDCEVFRKMQYEPSAVEDYANLALLFDRDADPDRKRYRKLWKVIDA